MTKLFVIPLNSQYHFGKTKQVQTNFLHDRTRIRIKKQTFHSSPSNSLHNNKTIFLRRTGNRLSTHVQQIVCTPKQINTHTLQWRTLKPNQYKTQLSKFLSVSYLIY